MDQYHEDEPVNGKLFNGQVAALLMRSLYSHKKYLALSLGLVAIITAGTLAVPYISKIVIDRLIVKQGSIAILPAARKSGGLDPSLEKRIARGVRLSDSS
jgi:hypothetical protein